MRITRVALSFFSVGLLAGTFEQAAGLGYAERGQRAADPAIAAAALAPASAVITPATPWLIRESRLPASGDEFVALHRAPLIQLGDGTAAEVVAALQGPAPQPVTTVALVAPSPAAAESGPAQRAELPRKPVPFFDPLTPEEKAQALMVPEPQVADRPKEFILPFEKGRVTSMFNQGRRHPAIDLAGPLGTPVYSTTRKQRVTFAGRQGGYGNLVITRDTQGRQHYYGHLQRTLARVGAMLEQGDLLGLLGSTGHSTGPHVHYEVRKPRGGHLDPSKLLFSGRVVRGYAWHTPRPEGSRLASRSGQPRPR